MKKIIRFANVHWIRIALKASFCNLSELRKQILAEIWILLNNGWSLHWLLSFILIFPVKLFDMLNETEFVFKRSTTKSAFSRTIMAKLQNQILLQLKVFRICSHFKGFALIQKSDLNTILNTFNVIRLQLCIFYSNKTRNFTHCVTVFI